MIQIIIGKESKFFVNKILYVSFLIVLKTHDFIQFQVRYGKITMNALGPFKKHILIRLTIVRNVKMEILGTSDLGVHKYIVSQESFI